MERPTVAHTTPSTPSGLTESPQSEVANSVLRPATAASLHARSWSDPRSQLLKRKSLPAKQADVLSQLVKTAPGVVKTRQGSVLSRGFILKTDYYPTGTLRNSHAFEAAGVTYS